jgi:UDP-N-acetylglucosamine diphosphorylase / glucose-1-phosphate thymidylyltransferase / UDP-N-acetylgalactosamine diphosphorylase / glucosamine-1-phosphate N-acetyltransferase / galactosamine-1-phosphate N-acetyltransferase
MGALTEHIPKPLLTIGGKNLLEYKINILPQECTEVVLIVGYRGEQIRDFFGAEYAGRRITYVESEPKGTGYSLFQAKETLSGRFIVMCGDDLYAKRDVIECLQFPRSALLSYAPAGGSGGKVTVGEDGYVEHIEEGTHAEPFTVATCFYVLDDGVFSLPLVPAGNGKDEYGLPQTLLQMRDMKMKAVYATAWHQVSAPEDLEITEEKLQPFL